MPTEPRVCDPTTIELNRTKANEAPWEYYEIAGVRVVSTDGDRVSLSVPMNEGEPSILSNKTWGDPQVMWVYCPSTLPSDAHDPPDHGRPPRVDATGTLYLEKGLVETMGIRAEPTPKWPRGLPGGEPPRVLRIAPISLVLRGVELVRDGRQKEGSVDLVNAAYAPRQTIEINGGAITVELTREGFKAFNVAFPDEDDLKNAVATIEARKDAAAMARAYAVLAPCQEAFATRRWPEPETKARRVLTAEMARALIGRVIDLE